MIQGVLLAAGFAHRFGSRKLLHPLCDGTPIGVAAARNLSRGMDNVLAVVRHDDYALAALLRAEGVAIVICERAALGISASLSAGIRAAPDADGWLIALADMPWIKPRTIRALVAMLDRGAAIVAPAYAGRRGHPVGFTQTLKAQLLRLTGDRGARVLLDTDRHRLETFDCGDPAILQDIDKPQDATSLTSTELDKATSRLRTSAA